MSGNQRRKNANFPVLGILAGLVFILAGLSAMFRFEFGFSLALVFVFAGTAVVLVALFGFRIHVWDLVLFIVALIILANVVGLNYYQNSRYAISSYSVGSQYVQAPRINIIATSGFGGINVRFSSNTDLAYQVLFQNSFFGFPFLNFGTGTTLTNQTRDGILYLNANSQGSITITIGINYIVSVNATTGVGSISFVSPSSPEASVQSVSLETGAGSLDAQINADNVSWISLKTGTGSIEFTSNYLDASGPNTPIFVNSGAGSINTNFKIANNTAVQIDATSGLGSISQHLTGFTIGTSSNSHLVASSGNTETASRSFLMTLSVGTGSINISGQMLSH